MIVSTIQKWIIGGLAVICLILAISGGIGWWQVQQGRAEISGLKTALSASEEHVTKLEKQAEANQVAGDEYRKLTEAINKKEAANRVRIDKALAANPDWASQPIPADVAAGLYSDSH